MAPTQSKTQLLHLHDDDLHHIASFLTIRDKGTCLRINRRIRAIMKDSLAQEKVLSTRLDNISRTWSSCAIKHHNAQDWNVICARLTFRDIVAVVGQFFPNLVALNLYGVLIDFDELTRLSHLPVFANLVHLELGYCGLWLNVEKFRVVLAKADRLKCFVFAHSAGVSFYESDAIEMWAQMNGTSTKKTSPYKIKKSQNQVNHE